MKKKQNNLSTSGANLGGGEKLLDNKKILGRTEKKILITSSIVLLLVIIIGVSYALWTFTISQEDTNTVETTCIKLEMTGVNAIRLQEAYPLTDEEAKELTPYTFTIKNLCNTSVSYSVNLEMMEIENRLNTKYVAISIDNEEKQILNTLEETTPIYDKGDYIPVEGRALLNGTLLGNESKSYDLRIWVDESTPAIDDAMNKKLISKVVVSASLNKTANVYQESILNGAYPVLAENLIPVEIDETGQVTKANLSSEWYSYENKKWANAVILEDESITYENNQEIPEDNIESYFVWIPKYSYELWDLGEYTSLTSIDSSKVHTIPIKFGTENTSDSNSGECTTPMTSGATGNCKIGDYMTPPAFITMGTNGVWVGKFETGYKGAASTEAAEINPTFTNASTEEQIKEYSNKIQIKPNVYSWRNIQVANAYLTSYHYQRELDSHMMKNTEWGAVAYLQHSRYGSATSVRINNNSALITGYAAKDEPTTGYTETNIAENIQESTALGVDGTNTYNYKNTNSQVASTTGNYTGIYDMSGGSLEYVMSVMLDSTNSAPLSGRNATNHSNFNGAYGEGGTFTGGVNFPSSRYFDTYNYNETACNDFSKRILGDATGEFGPIANVTYNSLTGLRQVGSWYADESLFFCSVFPWFTRGGHYYTGLGAGMFDFVHVNGSVYTIVGFRVVLAI